MQWSVATYVPYFLEVCHKHKQLYARSTDDKARTSVRNIVICLLLVYVKGAVIDLIFALFGRKSNKFSQNSTYEITA